MRGADHQPACRRRRGAYAEVLFQAVDAAENLFDFALEKLPLFGQLYASADLFVEFGLVGLLQQLYLFEHRGLADAQLFRSFRDVAVPGHHLENF